MFRSWRDVRSFPTWGVPLAECAVCGQAFHREPGYYLLAVWGLDYGITAVVGLALYAACWSLPTATAMWIVLPPLPVFAIAIARHTKALYFAVDTWLDPPRAPGPAGPGAP